MSVKSLRQLVFDARAQISSSEPRSSTTRTVLSPIEPVAPRSKIRLGAMLKSALLPERVSQVRARSAIRLQLTCGARQGQSFGLPSKTFKLRPTNLIAAEPRR